MFKKKGMSKKQKEEFNALSAEEKAEIICAIFENASNKKGAIVTANAILWAESFVYDCLYKDYVEKIDNLDADNIEEHNKIIDGLLGKIRAQHLKNIVGSKTEKK